MFVKKKKKKELQGKGCIKLYPNENAKLIKL